MILEAVRARLAAVFECLSCSLGVYCCRPMECSQPCFYAYAASIRVRGARDLGFRLQGSSPKVQQEDREAPSCILSAFYVWKAVEGKV